MEVLYLDIARALHMFGLAIGLGLALCADVFALKSLVSPVTTRDVTLLRLMHKVIMGGLLVLWISGLFLLQVRTGLEWANFSPKLITKLIVVALLSVNALIIGSYALPCYGAHLGRRFGEFALSSRLRMAGIAGLSLSCWLSALALGVFSQLKPMPAEALLAIFAPIFIIGLSGAVLMALGAPVLRLLPVLGSGALGDSKIERVKSRAIQF